MSGKNYRAEVASGLAGNPWLSLQSGIPGTNGSIPVTDAAPGSLRRFYRVVVEP